MSRLASDVQCGFDLISELLSNECDALIHATLYLVYGLWQEEYLGTKRGTKRGQTQLRALKGVRHN